MDSSHDATTSKKDDNSYVSVSRGTSNLSNLDSLTIEHVLKASGGFGALQWTALILLTILRNFGMPQLYTFALGTLLPKQLECLIDDQWQVCTAEQICGSELNHESPLNNTDYRAVNFFHNWATDELDLLCKPVSSYSFVCPVYFICYAIGIVFFMLPDLIGRRSTLKTTLIIYGGASYLSVFSDDIYLKTFGFAMQGWFHVKISVCFVHLTELVPEDSKVFALTVINCFDSVTMGLVSCLIAAGFSYERALQIYFFAGSIAIILYFALIPESPIWHFLVDGPNSQEGIAALNYIAWFNGCEYRLASTAQLDVCCETEVQDSTLLGMSMISRVNASHSVLHRSIMTQSSVGSPRSLIRQAKEIFKDLFSFNRVSKMHLKLKVLLISQCMVYYMILFNSVELPGDTIQKGIVFGVAEAFGVILVERIAHLVPDTQGCAFAYPGLAFLATALRHPSVDGTLLYAILCLQVMCIGFIWNVTIVIQESRMPPRHKAMSFELNYCVGQMAVAIVPVLSKMPEPVPLIFYWTVAIIGTLICFLIGPSQKAAFYTDEERNENDTFNSLPRKLELWDSQEH